MLSKKYLGYTFYEDGTVMGIYNKPLKTREHKGKLEVRLKVDGKEKYILLHRVLYYLFVEEFDISNKDLCVSTKDGNFKNLKLDNLVLKKRSELIQGFNKIAKLTDEQVEEIRNLYYGISGTNQHDKVGYSYKDLAEMYGCTKGQIKFIINGECRNKAIYKLK